MNTLLTVGYVSVDRTKQLLSCLRIPISTGAIQNMLKKAAVAAVEPVDRIKGKVSNKGVVNFDETGLRVAGSLHWLHCACSGPWRFYTVHEKRGEEGMEAMGILPRFTGVAVHDFWSSYKKFKNALHAMCCQHLERELVFAEETGNQRWAKKLRKLLQGMCHAKNLLMAEGKTSFTNEELQQYMKQYDSIVAKGLAANPLPERKPGKRGRLKKGKIRCLLERFQDFKADILRFATDWRVPYTNNAAEQAIRFARVKEKVSGCFRTEKGAKQFARVLSFISTAVRHGISSFDACLSLRNGTCCSCAGRRLGRLNSYVEKKNPSGFQRFVAPDGSSAHPAGFEVRNLNRRDCPLGSKESRTHRGVVVTTLAHRARQRLFRLRKKSMRFPPPAVIDFFPTACRLGGDRAVLLSNWCTKFAERGISALKMYFMQKQCIIDA